MLFNERTCYWVLLWLCKLKETSSKFPFMSGACWLIYFSLTYRMDDCRQLEARRLEWGFSSPACHIKSQEQRNGQRNDWMNCRNTCSWLCDWILLFFFLYLLVFFDHLHLDMHVGVSILLIYLVFFFFLFFLFVGRRGFVGMCLGML